MRGDGENQGAARARNVGIKESTGDIIFFMDDDIILDSKYIEEILRTYDNYSEAKGIQGYIQNGIIDISNFRGILLNSIHKVFLMSYVERNKCSYRITLGTYPYSPSGIIRCQWLHGSNCSYKREVLQKFRFDENLIKRSIGEDVDLSYRINKCYPNSLLMNPRATIIHESTSTYQVSRFTIYSSVLYEAYIFYKNIEQTTANKLFFILSIFGQFFISSIMYLFVKRDVKSFFSLIRAHIFTLKQIRDIKDGNLKFINRAMLNS